jgi:CheY-like chemotaxis protein
MTEFPRGRTPRILFVDDQREVARTLSALLKSLGAEYRFADDGEAGLRKLQAEVFDLALIDLGMPPDNTGGLWLLRRLAESGIRTPTVVLSGQEDFSDSVEAHRLGALGYVVKHKAGEELLELVTEALVDGSRARWQRATTELPAPIAIPLIRSRLHTDELHRLREGLMCAESVFRFTALASASRRRASLPEFFERPPSMGTWREFCRSLRSGDTPRALEGWLDAIADRSAGDLVKIRNDLMHGSGQTPTWAAERQAPLDDWLGHFLNVATKHRAPRIVVAGKLAHNGAGFDIDVADLAGAASSVVWDVLQIADPLLRKGRVYLVTDDASPTDLWPLVIAESYRPGQWDVSVLDSITRAGRLRYHDLNSGERVDSPTTRDELATSRL